MNRIIRYCVNQDDGIVYSRVGDEVAVPVLDFEAIGTDGRGVYTGDFRGPMIYRLEKCPVLDLRSCWSQLVWTKKISQRLKNRHRRFWRMKPLPPARRALSKLKR